MTDRVVSIKVVLHQGGKVLGALTSTLPITKDSEIVRMSSEAEEGRFPTATFAFAVQPQNAAFLRKLQRGARIEQTAIAASGKERLMFYGEVLDVVHIGGSDEVERVEGKATSPLWRLSGLLLSGGAPATLRGFVDAVVRVPVVRCSAELSRCGDEGLGVLHIKDFSAMSMLTVLSLQFDLALSITAGDSLRIEPVAGIWDKEPTQEIKSSDLSSWRFRK